MEVSAPTGNVIGTIEQEWSIFPRFKVKDVSGNVVLKIKGPFCRRNCFVCCNDVNFQMLSSDGTQKVGCISKKAKISKGIDNFAITFPMELDVKMKAVLLSACFLIDFLYFENDRKHGSNRISVGDDGYEVNDNSS